jgi:hypothetical protein
VCDNLDDNTLKLAMLDKVGPINITFLELTLLKIIGILLVPEIMMIDFSFALL